MAVLLISIAVVVNFSDAIKVLLTVNNAILVIGIKVWGWNVIEVVRKSRRVVEW